MRNFINSTNVKCHEHLKALEEEKKYKVVYSPLHNKQRKKREEGKTCHVLQNIFQANINREVKWNLESGISADAIFISFDLSTSGGRLMAFGWHESIFPFEVEKEMSKLHKNSAAICLRPQIF